MSPNEETPRPSHKSLLRKYLKCALQITTQEWATTGLEAVACPNPSTSATTASARESIEFTAECATSILLARIVALTIPLHKFKNASTTEICRTVLASQQLTSKITKSITQQALQELRCYVKTILQGYNDVPYHNYLHAYHVLLSTNKLLDEILLACTNKSRSRSEQTSGSHHGQCRFEDDVLMHMALIFAALIHDVDHLGVPNKQLVIENHPLALEYNSQSIAEQRSLAIAFTELLKADYNNLRQVLFTLEGKDYRRFREAITSLILATDISAPERGQAVRTKWESVFRKKDSHPHTSVQNDGNSKNNNNNNNINNIKAQGQGEKRKAKSWVGGATPLLAPPRDHPASNRRRSISGASPSSTAHSKLPISQRDRRPPVGASRKRDPWVECGTTPSTHFPRNAGPSMHESLVFWWFSPETGNDNDADRDDDDDESSVNSFSEESTAPGTIIHKPTAGAGDMDGSIWIVPDIDRGCDQSALSEDYPHDANSITSSAEDDSCQHLLSPPRATMATTCSAIATRLNRSATRSTNLFSPLPGKRDMLSSSSLSRYSDLSPTSSDHDMSKNNNGSKSKILGALLLPKRRSSPRSNPGIVVDMDSMPQKGAPPVDSISSFASTGLTVDMTVTDVSSSNMASSSMLRLGSSHEFDHIAEGDQGLGPKDEDGVQRNNLKANTATMSGSVDESVRSMSLMEHILLVADVSHLMQSWDSMNKFAHRLSKEIDASVRDGRSGGIKEDPLKEWYENQSAFLNGYVLPLAQRMEQSGTLPRPPSLSQIGAASTGNDEMEIGIGGYLTSFIYQNLQRWQEEGHEVIAVWRRERESVKTKKDHAKKNKRTTKKIQRSHSPRRDARHGISNKDNLVNVNQSNRPSKLEG